MMNTTHVNNSTESFQENQVIFDSVICFCYVAAFLLTLFIIFSYTVVHCCCFVKRKDHNSSKHVCTRTRTWLYIVLYSTLLFMAARSLQSGFSLAVQFYEVKEPMLEGVDSILQVAFLPLNTWILICFIQMAISIGDHAIEDRRKTLAADIVFGSLIFLMLLVNLSAVAIMVVFDKISVGQIKPSQLPNTDWYFIVAFYIAIPSIIISEILISLFGIPYTIYLFRKARITKRRDLELSKFHPNYSIKRQRKVHNTTLFTVAALECIFTIGIGLRVLALILHILSQSYNVPAYLYNIFLLPISELLPIASFLIILCPIPIGNCQPIGYNLLAFYNGIVPVYAENENQVTEKMPTAELEPIEVPTFQEGSLVSRKGSIKKLLTTPRKGSTTPRKPSIPPDDNPTFFGSPRELTRSPSLPPRKQSAIVTKDAIEKGLVDLTPTWRQNYGE